MAEKYELFFITLHIFPHNFRCVICMIEFSVGDPVRYLPCMHTYHTDCIGMLTYDHNFQYGGSKKEEGGRSLERAPSATQKVLHWAGE